MGASLGGTRGPLPYAVKPLIEENQESPLIYTVLLYHMQISMSTCSKIISWHEGEV